MSGSPSISRRVIRYLLLAQLFALLVGWAVWNGLSLAGVWSSEPTTIDDFAETRARRLILDSIQRAPDGSLRLEPTAALIREQARTPGFKFAVFTVESGMPLPGSSPELVAALAVVATGGAVKPQAMWFDWADQGPKERTGALRTQRTPYGYVRVASFGYRFHWYDVLYSLYFQEGDWMQIYFSIAFAACAASAWFAVRRGLAPLTNAVQEVERIDLDSLNQRIRKDQAPSEVLPFIEAVNGALERLDADAMRLRRFTANAAHELRTPVAILGARLDAPEEPSFKNDLKRDARRIRNIVEQLLASARLGGAAAPLGESIDLVAATQAVVKDAALLAIKNGRQIALEAPAGSVRTYGDRLAIESVIANLVDNALRAEPRGGAVLVRVTAEAVVEVVDHGAGVAPEDRTQIFEPFWRKTNATPGSGLGLAIAKELMDRHAGRIWVEETEAGGATFKLSSHNLQES